MWTVLLVDDEKVVLRVAQLTLEADGYRVLTAADADEARGIFESARDEIDLLVCDVGIPQVSGLTLAREFAARKPDLRVLLMSGCVSEPELHENRFPFLDKPFLPSGLSGKVEEVLGCSVREVLVR